MNFAYITQGKLFVKNVDKRKELIESEFGNRIIETATQINKKHEWKTQGRGAQFMGGAGPWGGAAMTDIESMRIHISAICRGRSNDEITYALDTDDIGGLFRYNSEKKNEHRLVHRQHINITHIDQHPTEELLVCSFSSPQGGMDIHYMKGVGRLNQITEGDSVDMAPSWVPNETETIVFQSAGVGRSPEGYIMGYGPFGIMKLSLSGKLETIQEDDEFDYLLPHCDSKGNLYYIKRPYEHPSKGQKPQAMTMVKDILLFPYRLFLTFLAFCNFMSMMLRGKPLNNAGGPQRDSKRDKMVWLMGRMVDTEKTLKENSRKGNQSIVPADWQLIKQETNGKETEIAKGILSFDINEKDEIIYTNGKKVIKLANGNSETLIEDKLVEHVAFI